MFLCKEPEGFSLKERCVLVCVFQKTFFGVIVNRLLPYIAILQNLPNSPNLQKKNIWN